jgi:hypothetical protein
VMSSVICAAKIVIGALAKRCRGTSSAEIDGSLVSVSSINGAIRGDWT